jgi:hypothetical protein
MHALAAGDIVAAAMHFTQHYLAWPNRRKVMASSVQNHTMEPEKAFEVIDDHPHMPLKRRVSGGQYCGCSVSLQPAEFTQPYWAQ